MTEIVLKVKDLAGLRKKWNQHIKHGVIFAPVHPVPDVGAAATVVVQPAFAPSLLGLSGTVAQASVGISVVQLDPLTDEARLRLVEWGIADAAPAGDVDVSAPKTDEAASAPPPVEETSEVVQSASAEVAAAPSPAAPAPSPASAEVAAAPSPAVPAPSPAAPSPSPAAPAAETSDAPPSQGAKFAPKAGAFKPGASKFAPKAGAFKPGASKFAPKAGAFKPGASKFAPGAARPVARKPPAKVGDVTDIRVVVAISGAATKESEALLPAADSKGTFGDETWRDVVLRLVTEQATGILVVQAFREIRWAYFVDGGPVHFLGDTPHAGEYLSDALAVDGVTDAEWLEAVRMGKLFGLRPGDYLVQSGRLSESALNGALTRRAERITRNLIGTNFGSWSFHEMQTVKSLFGNTPVNAVEVLMDSERKTQAARDNEVLIREMEPFYKHHVKMVVERKHLFGSLSLLEQERYIVDEMLSAGWTIGELVAYGGMLERGLLRFLSALDGMGLVRFVEEEGAISKRNRAERILWMGLRDLERRNPFEAIHAHWSSTPLEIEQGYRRLLSEYGMERFGNVADDRIEQLMKDLREKADVIYKKLSERTGRKDARKGYVGDDQLLMAVDLLDKQAQMALWKNDFAFVKACYERVLDLDPGVVEAGEARRNARSAMARPEVKNAKQPGEGRMDALRKQFDAFGE